MRQVSAEAGIQYGPGQFFKLLREWHRAAIRDKLCPWIQLIETQY